VLDLMHTARTSGTQGPEELRSAMLSLRPEQFGNVHNTPDGILRAFELSLLSDGTGTQIFSTTFVQWEAREVLRRAQPCTLLMRYAPANATGPWTISFCPATIQMRSIQEGLSSTPTWALFTHG
jgi:hypothetical protein